jgi:glyoxylase-like metal-dependent hydrolase (beta-lactamase superfamily II)
MAKHPIAIALLLAAPAFTCAAPAITHCAAQAVAVGWTPVKSIDFSSRHNVMIRSEDGTLTPMDVPYYRSKLIAPGTWQIESDGDYSYLLEGDKEALAIDTGYGAGNIREYLQTLTRKPVRFVANTHYHFDHTANDSYFDCAYMSAGTAEKATIPYPSFAGMNFPRNYPKVIVEDGYKIQLGNREIEVLLIPNHTAGGTAYLDRRARILFTGDEFMENIRLNVSVAQFAQNMRKLAAHRSEYDKLAGGPGMFDASEVDKYLAVAEYVLAGHEGERTTQQPRPDAMPAPADSAGQVIYQRRRVRAPDRPKDIPAPDENQRRMTYEGRSLTYDVRHIQ